MEKEKNIHEGHRKRMRERYLASGPEGFADHELLEMLLFQSIPRGNTNGTAHDLLECFGSMERVICSDAKELRSVDGVGDTTAVMFSVMGEVFRRIAAQRCELPKSYNQTEMIVRHLHHKFVGETSEKVYMLLLDNGLKILGCVCLNEGSAGAVQLNPRVIAEHVIRSNASAVVLAHNHPSGSAIPSEEDITSTYRLKNFLETVHVALLEHFVFSDDHYLTIMDKEPEVQLYRTFEPVPIENDFYHNYPQTQDAKDAAN